MDIPLIRLDAAFLFANGYAIVPDAIDHATVSCLRSAMERLTENSNSDREIVGGIRNLLGVSDDVRRLAQSMALRSLVEQALGRNSFAVRAILFDKTPGSNWKVPWHQDVTIAVRERRAVPGFGPWTVKAGIEHVQPTRGVLEGMLSVRLHLDDCSAANGPLQVLPATHLSGRLDAASIQRLREEIDLERCLADAGGVVLMRPLLLHSSSAATSPAHRRVIHIDYAATELPYGLEWNEKHSSVGDAA